MITSSTPAGAVQGRWDMQETYSRLTPLIPAMRRYARGMTRDRTASDDLVQDCLEKALGSWHKRRSEDPRSWVFAILHNLSINHLKRARQFNSFDQIETLPERLHATPPYQDTAVFGRQVLTALANLPPIFRSVLLLVTVEERSYAEVSLILQIPVGTVMSRLSRARDQLHLLLGERSMTSRPIVIAEDR